MTELSLFSGAGGGLLGTKLLGFQCVGYVERDEYCQQVIRARIRDGYLDDAPIFPDVRAFSGLPYRGRVDLLTAGFPCQPFSVAGKKRGADDERNMWPDTLRVLCEVRPRWALLENVPGLLGRHGYYGTILGELAEAGFHVRWDCVSAQECGAPHRRERLWMLVSDSECDELRHQFRGGLGPSGESPNVSRDDGAESGMADAWSSGREECAMDGLRQGLGSVREARLSRSWTTCLEHGWWSAEPALGRVADGVADRMVQLRALGNGQVPCVVVEAMRTLTVR